MIYGVILGLLLQLGTTGAAVVVLIFTPAVGLGCGSLGYIVYGGLAIIIMFLNIFSTILARISEIREDNRCWGFLKSIAKPLAIVMRYTSWPLALLNSVGIIAWPCLQFSNLFSKCYCNLGVLGNGKNINTPDFISSNDIFHAAGILTALGTILVFRMFLGCISSYKRKR